MARPVWTKEDAYKDSNSCYITLGLVMNTAKVILSLETETKATFGVSLIPMGHKLWQANRNTSNTLITLNLKGQETQFR